jgi:hypothetical protein
MSYTAPTLSDFKTRFTRDFPFGATPSTDVTDTDIQNAMDEVECNINEELFCDEAQYQLGYLLLAAHYLVMNLRASSQGIAGSFDWNTASKSVGSVSVSQSIPESIMKNPLYAYMTTSTYGAKYLMMVYPNLMGQMFAVEGTTIS